jgi:hypothetical protein
MELTMELPTIGGVKPDSIPDPVQIAADRDRRKKETREVVLGTVAIVISVLAALFTGWQAYESHQARIDARDAAKVARQDAGDAAAQARKDSQAAIDAQTKLADRSAEQAKRSASAAETANKLAAQAMRQAQRPWIGPDIKTPVITGPIVIDQHGTIITSYQMTAVNYGSFGANNINFWAQLYVAQDITTIWERGKYACAQATGNPTIGRIMFPGQERIMTNPWPALAMDVIPNTKATPPQKEFQAYLLTCIGYRDQFGAPHHTGTIFRSVRPQNGETVMFELTPNQSIPVEWREWHSFLD